MKKNVLNYKLNDFMTYKGKNEDISLVPLDVKTYLYNTPRFDKSNIGYYTEQLEFVISAVSGGTDANEMEFKNNVKRYLNVINDKNYSATLTGLERLDYNNEMHINFLATEIIFTAIKCPVAIRGGDKEKTNKTISELCSDLILYFSETITQKKNYPVNFQDEILSICRKLFMDFIKLTTSLDEHNENTVDNYKGFMTLLGNIYSNGLISITILLDCIDSIQRTIFCTKQQLGTEQINNSATQFHEKMFGSQEQYDINLYNQIMYFDTDEIKDKQNLLSYRKQIECTNFYKGYEFLIMKILYTLRNKIIEIQKIRSTQNDNDKIQSDDILLKIKEYLYMLTISHDHFVEYNEKFTTEKVGSKPLKTFTIMTHNRIKKEMEVLFSSIN
jgi:hypothetical protein